MKLGIVSFDGRVVEFFPNYGNDLAEEWDFEDDRQPAVVELVQAVLAARGVG